MRKAFYVVRHTESEGDSAGIMQGQGDDDLTLIGIKEAQQFHDLLIRLEPKPMRCVTSGLKRSSHMAIHAKIDKVFGTPATADADFNSVNLGKYNGRLKHNEMHDLLKNNPQAVVQAGGENNEQLDARIMRGFHRHVCESEVDDVPLFIVHGATIHHLLKHLGIKLKHVLPAATFRIEAEIPEGGNVPDFRDPSRWKVHYLKISHAGIGDDPIQIDEFCVTDRFKAYKSNKELRARGC